MKIYLLIATLCCALSTLAQNSEIDSLKAELKNVQHDTSKVLIQMRIGFLYYQISPDSLIKYTQDGMELSKSIGYQKGIANGYNNFGTLAYAKSRFDEAVENYQKFLEISEDINFSLGVNKGLNNLGVINKLMGNYSKSLEYYERSLQVSEEINNLERKAATLNNMGLVYRELGELGKALEYYFKSIEIKERFGDEKTYANTYSSIGTIYLERGDYKQAMDYYTRAFEIYKRYDLKLGMARVYQDLGSTYQGMDNLEKAQENYSKGLLLAEEQGNENLVGTIKYDIGSLLVAKNDLQTALVKFEEAQKIYEEIGFKIGSVKSLISMAKVYYDLGDFSESIEMAKEGLNVGFEINVKKEISEATKLLHLAYNKIGYYKKAYEYALLHQVYYDSINRDLQLKELAIFENRFQLDKISSENQILANQNRLNEATIERNKLQIQRQNLIIFGGSFMFLLSLTAIYIGYRYYQSRKRSIQLLERKNQEITIQSKVLAEQADELIKVNEEIQRMNESLEEKVRKRTAKIQIQNEKLREYAFSNAHLVRAPLARILGITNQIKTDTPESQKRILNESLLDSAEELDQVIRKVNDILNDEDLD